MMKELKLVHISLLDIYKKFRFRLSMIGVYVNVGRGRTERPRRVESSPAVQGARYRITAWALGGGSRSARPAVEHVTTGDVL